MSHRSDAIKIWALGRPFSIGALYNYIDDTIIPKIHLWESANVSRVAVTNTDVKSTAKVHSKTTEQIDDDQHSDGEEEQASFLSQLGMDDHTAMSLTTGLLRSSLKGAGRYAADRFDTEAQSSSRAGQVTIHCRSTSKKISVDPNQRLEIICRPERLVTSQATHVVIAITYGLEAFCIFPQHQVPNQENEPNNDETMMEITNNYARLFHYRLINECQHLERDAEGDDEDGHRRPIPEGYRCIVYSDLMVAGREKNCRTLKPVAEQYEACRKVVAHEGKAIPLRVWLYPLHKLVPNQDGRIATNVPSVSRNLLNRCDHLFSHYRRIRAEVEMLIQKMDRLASHQCIPLSTSSRIQYFRESLIEFIAILLNALKALTISIRRGTAHEDAMAQTIQAAINTQSPFNVEKLNSWLNHHKIQIKTLKRLSQLDGVLFTANVERLEEELSIRNDGSYAVVLHLPSLANKSKGLLDEMDRYIDGISQTTSISWTKRTSETDGQAQQLTALKHLQIYAAGQEFSSWVMNNNRRNYSVRYIISYDECSGKDDGPISPCTQLYQCGRPPPLDFMIPKAPGPVTVEKNRHGVIVLSWIPGYVTELSSYLFQYRSVNGDWESIQINGTPKIEMNYLQSGDTYLFRVAAETLGGRSPFSAVSQEVTIDPVSPPPTGLQADKPTDTSIAISWHHQHEHDCHGNEVKVSIINYSVECWSGDCHRESTFVQRHTKQKTIVLEPLVPGTTYHIQVRVVCADSTGSIFHSPASEILKSSTLKEPERAAHIVRRTSQKFSPSPGIDVYQLPLKSRSDGQSQGVGRYVFGEPSYLSLVGKRRQRTILVLGATGSGKTTLINAMVNYVLGIEWEDNFRFKLIDEPDDKSQAHSQTDSVTTYDLYEVKDSRLGYSLTIVDTPGFGDTRGMDKDKKTMQLIEDCFKSSQGVQQLEAVCFVVQSGLARLTPTQQYIFDSILSIFGHDIQDNIRLMVTFADNDVPPILEAVKEAGIPSPIDPSTGMALHHKFNSSIFFANKTGNSQTDEVNQNYFDLGVDGFDGFFDDLSRMEVKSLTLTRKVLEKRKRLQALVEGLQLRADIKLTSIEAFEQTKKLLTENQQQMEENKNFDFEVEFLVPQETDISGTGQFTTNCQKCTATCHFPCRQANDADKRRCSIMDPSGHCMICKCPWNDHFNQKYRYEMVKEKVPRSSDAIRNQYQGANTERLTNEELLASIQKEIEQHDEQLMELVQAIHPYIQQLNRIALRPHALSIPAYIDLMITSEKQRCRPGYQQKIATLRRLRKVADLTTELVNDQQEASPSSRTQRSHHQEEEGIVNRRRSSCLFVAISSLPKN